MLNMALRNAGHNERFITLASSGQIASFVLADPAKLAPLAQRFHMALSEDPEEAMKKGRQFEEQVIRSLEGK